MTIYLWDYPESWGLRFFSSVVIRKRAWLYDASPEHPWFEHSDRLLRAL